MNNRNELEGNLRSSLKKIVEIRLTAELLGGSSRGGKKTFRCNY